MKSTHGTRPQLVPAPYEKMLSSAATRLKATEQREICARIRSKRLIPWLTDFPLVQQLDVVSWFHPCVCVDGRHLALVALDQHHLALLRETAQGAAVAEPLLPLQSAEDWKLVRVSATHYRLSLFGANRQITLDECVPINGGSLLCVLEAILDVWRPVVREWRLSKRWVQGTDGQHFMPMKSLTALLAGTL